MKKVVLPLLTVLAFIGIFGNHLDQKCLHCGGSTRNRESLFQRWTLSHVPVFHYYCFSDYLDKESRDGS